MARFGDGLAVGPDLEYAARAAVRQAVGALDAAPDLLLLFVCGNDGDQVERAGVAGMRAAGAAVTIGCSTGGVIGGGRAVESTSAVSAWAAVLPGARLTPFELRTSRAADHLIVAGMPEPDIDDQVGLLLADPFRFPADGFVERSADTLGPLPLIGGLAGSPNGREDLQLFIDGEPASGGAVGVLVGGDVALSTVVSQGSRPIGPTMTVTGSDGNEITELAGIPALEKLERILDDLPDAERPLAAEGLSLGVAMDEYAERHERGDFLIRGVVGVDSARGALAISDIVPVGRTVRFQVHDAAGADEDLAELLEQFAGPADFGRVAGALLFSCNGRGGEMFAGADHDLRAVRRGLSTGPVAGFFASGEIGPVAGRNHVHSFTASILAFGDA